jgi:hypothetical protein
MVTARGACRRGSLVRYIFVNMVDLRGVEVIS